MTNVTPLPTRLHVAEQSPAGRHGFEEPADAVAILDNVRPEIREEVAYAIELAAATFPPRDEPDRIEITAGVSKVYAVRVDGIIWAEFSTATNAIRCAGLLGELERLGALTPTNVVRHMLARSVREEE